MSIKHTTTVDIGDLRTLSKPIHLMQYDKSLPEIEVHITKDGQEYTIPSGYSATIRWGKPDKHGCTATGTVSGSTVTFQVTEQMACVAGRSKVTVEIVESDSSQAGTAKFEVIIDSNPIGDNTIVSDSEIADIQKAIEAGQNADKALETANQAQSIIDDVTEKAESASTLINNATESLESSVETARGYAESAITSASNASASAKSASDTVSGFDTHVAEKETELDTYTSGKKTELDTYTNTEKKVIDEYLDQVGEDIMSAKDTAVTASETAAAKANEASTSATTASEKATEASASATKAKESETNAKLSETNASNSAKEAKASANSVANVVSDVSQLKEDITENTTNINKNKTDIATNAGNITKNANDIKTLQEDLSSVGQQAEANSENIENLRNDVSRKFFESGLGILRTGKLYGTKVWKSAVNNSQTLEKTYDNAGLVCVPSTDTTVGQDDYADIPLFQWVRCTYKRYDDGFAYPTSIEGDGNYSEEGDVDCGSMMRTFYYKEIDNNDYTEVIISDTPNHAIGLKPWEQAVRADGTIMPYFINSRYHSVVGTDGKLYSNRGRISRSQSHDNMITNYQKKGAGYWGAGSDRYTLAQIMMFIKYGTKSIQKVMAGVTNHNVQIKASIQSEEANTYFPVTNSQASSILVGTRFSVGYGTFNSSGKINVDRGNGTIHAYADDVVVTAKVPMDDGVNTAIYLDCTSFNTMPITDSNGYTSDIYLTSMHAWSGDTDSVIGHHDGSPVSNTDSKHPCRIQGIEFMMGGYTVASDTVMFFKSDYSKDVYVAPRGVAHSTSDSTIQSTYTLVGNIPANNGSDFWIGDVSHVNGVWYPSTVVSSDQYGMGDRCYAGGQSTSGSREYLQGGVLGVGSYAGLACLDCWLGLWHAVWGCLSAD